MPSWCRIIIVLAAVLGATVFVATGAANTQVKTTFSNQSFTGTLTGVCAFDVQIYSVGSGFEIDHYDAAGNFTSGDIHSTYQDTFTANGKTLTGLPYTGSLHGDFDSSGDITRLLATGNIETVPLPDGTVFRSAGQVNFLNHPDEFFVISADKGNPGNIAGFCAALSP